MSRSKDFWAAVRKVEMKPQTDLDRLLRDWQFDPRSLAVRLVKGDDGRDVIQMRVDLGVLQMETQGRPDGVKPEGMGTYLDALLAIEKETPDFEMTEEQCFEADREFVQFYHRRVAWLRLQKFRRAVEDAEHTLSLMDFCGEHSPDEEWTNSHEEYRLFVLFHRTHAEALASIEEGGPEDAVALINKGLEEMKQIFVDYEAEEQFEEDEMVSRLSQLRESLREEYAIGRTLQERLDEAVATEQYELAARLRDELDGRKKH